MNQDNLKRYQANYQDLPFEDNLRVYRQANIIEAIVKFPHKKILEIGSGFDPLFKEFSDFERMVVIEPGEIYYSGVKELAGNDKRIKIINGYFEKIVDSLLQENFDIIIIGGFLHEIMNPDEVLQAVKKLCSPTTVVHSFVPNAHSFHRLLAFEMDLIKDIYERSGNDILFQRYCVYDIESYKSLFLNNGFTIESSGTYFIKPFSHSQLDEILKKKIVDRKLIDGLNKISKYFPNNGAEIYINSKLPASNG